MQAVFEKIRATRNNNAPLTDVSTTITKRDRAGRKVVTKTEVKAVAIDGLAAFSKAARETGAQCVLGVHCGKA